MNRAKKLPSKNPQLLNLLKAGCTITFPDGYYFIGDIRDLYIKLKTPLGFHDGQVHLTKKGLTEAFMWKKKYFQSLTKS